MLETMHWTCSGEKEVMCVLVYSAGLLVRASWCGPPGTVSQPPNMVDTSQGQTVVLTHEHCLNGCQGYFLISPNITWQTTDLQVRPNSDWDNYCT